MQLNSDGAQALTNLLNTLGPNLAPDNKQIDFRHLTQTYTQPRMTQHELKQFANARNVSKTQLDNFVERLQNLFNASYNDPDAMAEAKALRILHNNLDYRRLTPLCQAYVDPTASFAAPRTHYWRFTHHIHLDECITRGPDNVDLATAIDRIGRNFNRAMQTINERSSDNRRRDNDNRNRRNNDNCNRRSNNYNTSNNTGNNRNSQRPSYNNSNNRTNNYRQREQRSSNNTLTPLTTTIHATHRHPAQTPRVTHPIDATTTAKATQHPMAITLAAMITTPQKETQTATTNDAALTTSTTTNELITNHTHPAATATTAPTNAPTTETPAATSQTTTAETTMETTPATPCDTTSHQRTNIFISRWTSRRATLPSAAILPRRHTIYRQRQTPTPHA